MSKVKNKHRDKYIILGQNIRNARKAIGMSQEGLAFEINSNRNYVGCVERAEKRPSLAFIFDVTEIELNSIYDQLKLDVYDFWKIILPSNTNLYHAELQKHLEEIDYQLSTFLIWRNPSNKFKNELKEFLENENLIKDEKEKNSIYKLILHESSLQSSFLFHNKNF